MTGSPWDDQEASRLSLCIHDACLGGRVSSILETREQNARLQRAWNKRDAMGLASSRETLKVAKSGRSRP